MIFPAITTTDGKHLEKIREADLLGIAEVCLFPTVLELKGREALYKFLEKSAIRKIPLVHLRSDMEIWELDFFVKNFKTEVFNIHSPRDHPFLYDHAKYRKQIYIENTLPSPFEEEEVRNFAGICIDFAHLEDSRLGEPADYHHNIQMIERFPCGCAHISAVRKTPGYGHGVKRKVYNFHYLKKLSELDYLKRYPRSYFPPVIALELENSLAEQLKIRDHLVNLLEI